MSNSFELTGMEDLLDKLENLGKQANKIEKTALEKASVVLEREIKANVPVASGKLRDSIKVSKIKSSKKDGKTVWVGDVDRETDYSWSVEFGHVAQNGTNVPANPFMSRSFENKQGEIKSIIKDEIRKGLGLS